MDRRFAGLLVAAVLALPAGAGAAPSDPLEYVRTKYAEIQAVVKKFPEKEAMQQGIRDVMETFVDYRELSKRTLPDSWDKLAKKQQDGFVDEFKKMIQRTYVRRFNPNKEVAVEYKGATTEADGTSTVNSIVHSGRSEARVDYRFHKKGAQLWAFDVVIDDVSMVKNYRKQFHDIMAKSNFDGLMDKIRKRNAKAQE